MADTAFSIKQNSQFPPIRAALLDAFGNAVPLSGTRVFLRLKRRGITLPAMVFEATVVDYVNSIVSYSWADGDTAMVGDYDVEWLVLYPDGKKSIYPSNTYNRVLIVRSLA